MRMKQENGILGQSCIRHVVRRHLGHLAYNAHSCEKVADAGMTRSKL